MGNFDTADFNASSHHGWVDLHVHTTASDGDLTPAAVVEKAAGIGLRALAITDHDTVQGVPEALARGREVAVEVIPGVEISVEAGQGRTFHMLGYFVDPQHRGLLLVLKDLQMERLKRNDRMLKKLASMGMPLDSGLLAQFKGHGLLGRPHIAQAMVRQGYVATVQEAFERFLGRGRPAYVEKFRLRPKEAVLAIRRGGGIPVIAHPQSLGFQTPLEFNAFVKSLVEESGVMGIEVVYPDQEPNYEALFISMAKRYGLLMTGGSDFHGAAKPAVELGWGKGTLRVPYAWVEALKQRAMSIGTG